MRVSDFDFELPDELIARYPQPERTASRMLHLDGVSGDVRHRQFTGLPNLLNPNDLLVFNNTRVIPARIFARKATGGKAEILIERITGEFTAIAHVRASKSPPTGTKLILTGTNHAVTVTGRDGQFFLLSFPAPGVASIAQQVGHMPLPPYIDREDELSDRERYQTVYAKKEGAVAAPTAGLHFDESMLETIRSIGVNTAEVTLHVGAGTFQPVRVDDVKDHEMHSEWLQVNADVCDAVAKARESGGRVIAVGTTSVRSLETASASGELLPFSGDTNIFIYPGYQFQVVDAMITNFHLPGSTLMMLVSAFAGADNIRHAYQSAIAERYRFFSYGDAMFLSRK